MSPVTPKTLTVVLVNTWRTQISIVHENEHMPYTYRTVHIELTPEQRKQLEPKSLGVDSGRDVREEFGSVWLENFEETEVRDEGHRKPQSLKPPTKEQIPKVGPANRWALTEKQAYEFWLRVYDALPDGNSYAEAALGKLWLHMSATKSFKEGDT